MRFIEFSPARFGLITVALAVSLLAAQAQTEKSPAQRPVGPGNVMVNPALGGTILGFDIDQNGSEGLLSEAALGSGKLPYATETFDQATGKIIEVGKGEAVDGADDDVTWGVVGHSVGLVEHDYEFQFEHPFSEYLELDPLSGNKVTGQWLAPGNKRTRIYGVSRNQGTPVNAFQVLDYDTLMFYVYGSDVAANKFGPVIQIASYPGIIGLNTKSNTAFVFASNGDPFGASYVNQVDLTKGTVTTFLGIGSATIQGVAVDSADNILVTTTYGDSSVEFYDLTTHTQGLVPLPNCSTPACSGFDVEFDPIHKLFLVAQPVTSQGVGNTSTIYVFDTHGDILEILNGFNFYTQRFDVFPVHIALHPSERSGFVDVTNDSGVGAIQQFTY